MKKYLWMSSAAVVIGALRVKFRTPFLQRKILFVISLDFSGRGSLTLLLTVPRR